MHPILKQFDVTSETIGVTYLFEKPTDKQKVHNFIAAVTDHRCDIGGMNDGDIFANLTQDQRLTINIPAQDDGSLSSCKMFTEPQFHLLYNSSNATEIPAVPCQYGWVYDTSTFSSTLAMETLSNIVVLGKGQKTYTYLDLVRTPKMRRLALLTGIIWFGIALTFYGISFNITGFGMNIYLTQFVYATIEVPAKLSVYYLLDKIGRRNVEVGSLLGAGLCLAINIFIPKDMSLCRSIVAILGKGCSSASFATVFLFTSELYPTVVRQNGMGYNSCMARLGVSIAPLIILLDDLWEPLPQVIICTVAITTGLVARLLPETKDKRLPETIEDVEQTRKGLVSQPIQEKPDIPMESLMKNLIEKGT
ncbi:hypothetical protein SKAU_G00180970 [Synaphobranchus kaupii]|uniref:Solute carrier family 22 member 7-like n=1 Tax=Synaphobranchus kaupii TaxID=118154 RepID=A0A9Q1FMS0_SYNKA|nr:hypothetical protein SKAU_G00180970 [Synaphobranchus kaupii]